MDSQKVIESLRLEFQQYEKSKQISEARSNKILRRVTLAVGLLALLVFGAIVFASYWYNYSVKNQVLQNFNAVLENQRIVRDNHYLDSITRKTQDSFMKSIRDEVNYKRERDSLFNLK